MDSSDTDHIYTARRGSATIRIDGEGGGATATSSNLYLSRRSETTTVLVENGGTWEISTLYASSRESSAYNPRVNMTVRGENSRFETSGTANLGQTQGTGDFTAEYARLTVEDEGQFIAGGTLVVRYSGRVTIDGGTVTANNLTVYSGIVDGADSAYGAYRLTLRQDQVGQAAPFVVTNAATIASAADQADRFDFVLLLDEDYTPTVGDTFGVMSYGTLSGYFRGLAPNSSTVTFEQDEVLYELDYGAMTSADTITLTVIPEPGVVGMFLVGLGAIGWRRRLRG